MPLLNSLVKRTLSSVGLTISRRDRLAEQIPANYIRSPYLPPIYRQSLARLICFQEMFERIKDLPGDVVECGVSIGTGILNWSLLSELSGSGRNVVGFDSFSGFPPSVEADRKADRSFATRPGEYASPPELVLKILEDGRVSPEFVTDHVHLVRGYFDATVSRFGSKIALLHLDCDLYESYRTCLEALYPKVVSGGIILFDEYGEPSFPGARRAVDEFFEDKVEKPLEYRRYDYVKHYVVRH